MKHLIRIALVVIATTIASVTPLQVFADYDQDFYSGNDILFYNPDDGACSTSGSSSSSGTSAPGSLSGANNEEKIWNYLISAGFTPVQAAGMMGNMETESGGTWAPTVNEFSAAFPGKGYGIVQWTGTRRDQIVAALTSAHSDLMAKYYNADYSTDPASYTDASQGYVPKSASTGTLMPVADNDALLLTELQFMLQELGGRVASTSHGGYTVTDVVGLASGMTEQQAIQAQTSINGAAEFWLADYEVGDPSSITAREQHAQDIYNQFTGSSDTSTSGSGSSCDTTAAKTNQTKQQLAQQILASNNISYWADGGLNATQKILTGIADGSNNGNDWPCGMNINILKILVAITKDHKVVINSSNRACTNDVPAGGFVGDRHYNGNGSAIDFGSIDGEAATTTAGASLLVKLTVPEMVDNSGFGQAECPGMSSAAIGIPSTPKLNRFNDLCTHLHADVPPASDPNLQYHQPVV